MQIVKRGTKGIFFFFFFLGRNEEDDQPEHYVREIRNGL